MKNIVSRIAALAMTACISGASPAMAQDDVVIVYDGSGSMWGQIDGTSKVEIAREVLGDLVTNWDDKTNLGLVAYGHRTEGDCTDIETMIDPGPLDRAAFIAKVNAISPVGKTPISASVKHAADLLSYRDNPATVVLISDGVETCNADPCALSAQLAKQGVAFTVHVVGFDLDDAANASLSCIAENTGGVFVPASNALELTEALAQVQSAMDLKPVTPEPEPVAEEPARPEVTVTGPEQVTIGAVFDVAWSKTINPRDFITIVPMGADEGTSAGYIRANADSEGRLTAPAETGLYELRYVLDTGAVTLASAPIEVVEAEVGIFGPEQVTMGAVFDVAWSKTINPRDFITIVPMGADEGTSAGYIRANADTEGRLTAPAEPGLYELRYVLETGRVTLARATIEVVEAEATVSGPAQVATGAIFNVAWSKTINPRDLITIVPMGADEGTSAGYIRANADTEGRLTAPAEPGLYELRYVLETGRVTLATAMIEVVEAEIGISGPGTVRAGTAIDITWSSNVNPRDYITIVPMGADEGTSAGYIRVADVTQGRLTAPDETGLYEMRYVLEVGKRTLASAPLEVVGADAPLDDGAGLSVPATAAPGETITVTWTLQSTVPASGSHLHARNSRISVGFPCNLSGLTAPYRSRCRRKPDCMKSAFWMSPVAHFWADQ
ncbi:vWA domain-containing protein [Yoonia sp. MH D7]